MAIQNQYYVTDYFCIDTEKYNSAEIRKQFPIDALSTHYGYLPPNFIYCEAFGTRFGIPPLSNGAPDWELLQLTLNRASKGDFSGIRRSGL